MKKYPFLLAFAALLVFGLQSCLKDSCERTVSYIRFDPVYKTKDEIHNYSVVSEAPRALKNPGQLYYYDDQIFINERGEGIHVIDNSNPASPAPVAFLAIPGNEDLAIKNGILYANTYIDLLAVGLADYQLKGRVNNIFPPLWEDLSNGQLLVNYVETPVTEVMDCESFGRLTEKNGEFFSDDNIDVADFDGFLTSSQAEASNATSGGNGGAGVGGSMARFTIMGDYLYTIDEWAMDLFSLTQPETPAHAGRVEIGWGIETIFPYEDKLFIGSNNGMFIYDNNNPLQPTLLTQFAHASACDPVFVKDNYAYVTLRSGNECQGFTNQLDLIDITNLTSPVLKKTFQMDNPHGLSIKADKLFLCEGESGLKSFDITDPLTLGDHQLDQKKDLHAFDAISLPGGQDVVMVIGQDGFYQYEFDAAGKMELLSKISIER